MRIRKISTIFSLTCIAVFIFILYMVTDMSLKLPSIKPAIQELDDNKWTAFESKLKHIENELNQHHAVVGEIKTAVDQIVEQSNEIHSNPKRPPKEPHSKPKVEKKIKQEFKTVGDEPPKMLPISNTSSLCSLQTKGAPKSDIQMLSMYESITFDDIDGGVWKQGWDIEFSEDQWNSKNKLKVYIVPHSHNDPGWIKTFEEYYRAQTKSIFNNMVEKLPENPDRKFIWAETSYLSLWWTLDANEQQREVFRKLLHSGQLEIVTGGWVMNDEANSHWLSIIQQLTTGHQWLLDNFGYIPKNSWSIDPFGYSSSQPYLLKLAGFENALIQRVHYRIKKELARNRQLEFNWRQLWDGEGKTDMFTHLMPFYSYDVPHTCGPDPKVCCQFDFRRLPGNGMSCPWSVAPKKIIAKNVRERSNLILDQWRKKAQLYRSNVLLVPLGDDFRYDTTSEWDNQYKNYEALIEYINNDEGFHAQIQFGTLEDYFKALHADVKQSNFPVLTGDFFTYADRNEHYWSGYYTSRPFYKSMDRVLLAYLRAAEIIISQATASKAVSGATSLQLRDLVEEARRALALFQHHDGVTGTARDHVMVDYAKKMLKAIKHSQAAIQRAAFYLLKQPPIQDQTQEDIFFDVDDLWTKHDELSSRITITLDEIAPARRIVLYNSLSFKRHQILTVIVSTPHVEVYDSERDPVRAQISPVVSGDKRLSFAANKFELSFPITVDPLSVTMYTVSLRDISSLNKYTSFTKVRIYNADYWTIQLPQVFAIEQPSTRLSEDITFHAGNSSRVVTNMNGMLKAIVSNGVVTPVHMDYVHYDSRNEQDNNSGGYLFIPSGMAMMFKPDPYPEVVVMEGPYKASLYTALIGENAAEIVLSITVHDNPSLPQSEVEISNKFLISHQVDNLELAMRFSTHIANGNTFYTDLNGMQIVKRKYFDKLPLQANFYPLSAAAYIEDEKTRLTVLTSTPLGVAALEPGQIEIVQDRRLNRDDNRGLQQGVLDNVRTRHTFRLIVEQASLPRANKLPEDHPSGYLTLGAHVSQQLLLHPPITMQYTAALHSDMPVYNGDSYNYADVVLASYHSHVAAKSKDGHTLHGAGLTFQRVHLNTFYGNRRVYSHYTVGDGQIHLPSLTKSPAQHIFNSTLTFVNVMAPIPSGILSLCPMEIKSVFVNNTVKH